MYHFTECHTVLAKLKELLTSTPILHPPIWAECFKLMCDVSNYPVVLVLGQCVDKKLHVIYYTSHTLNEAQLNYTITERDSFFWGGIFGFEKFKPHLIGSYVIVYTNHSALKHLLSKKDAKPRLVSSILLL